MWQAWGVRENYQHGAALGPAAAMSPGLPDATRQISRSLRLRASASAYLSRTPGAAGNQLLWTWSGWIKRGTFGTTYCILGASVDTNNETLLLWDSEQLRLYNTSASSTNMDVRTSAVFRDPSAWCHVVVNYDAAQATSTNRVRIYVNGVLQSLTGTFPASTSQTTYLNGAVAHVYGNRSPGFGFTYLDQYFADVYFVDGQSLDASNFGQLNTSWNPKLYSGAFGTNGYHLEFADNSGATATTIGKDTSGNGNNFTPNNISITVGATNDSFTDTPTNYGIDTGAGGEVRGNYPTLSPLAGSTTGALSDGNLVYTGAGSGGMSRYGTIGVLSGKWYWEQTCITAGGAGQIAGISNDPNQSTGQTGIAGYYYDGSKDAGGTLSAYGAAFTTGDVVGIAFDADNGTIFFYKNGVSQGQAFSGLTSGPYFPVCRVTFVTTASVALMNFGQRPFANAAPSGYKALCTHNLAAGATVGLPSTFTGNASAEGPFVWAGGIVSAVTINGNVATAGTHFDKLANGIKLRTASASYNAAGSNTITTATYGIAIKDARAQVNP